jgi:hypothetical protein
MPALPSLHDATVLATGSLTPRGVDVLNHIARQLLERFVPKSLYSAASLSAKSIQARQQPVPGIIPTYYKVDGPAPGTVVGIVLGSIAGFILIVWLLYSLTQGNTGRNGTNATIAGEEEIVVRRRRGSQSHAGRSSRRNSRPQMQERSRTRSPRRSGGRSTIIVEERRGPRPRSIVVEERSRSRVRGDDVVEVIEEHDSDFRATRNTRRGGGYR